MAKCKTKAIQTALATFRQNQTYSGIIQVYSGIFRTFCYLDMFKWCIQNPNIFRIRNIFSQARSQEFLRAGEVSTNQGANLWQFRKSKLNESIKVCFFQLQFQRMGCYVCLPIPYNRSSLSRDHQTVTIMNHCCYCFDGLWKVKYIVLCLNALAKFQNVRETSRRPVFMGNCPTCSHMPCPYQSMK